MAGKTRLALTMLSMGKDRSLRRRIRDKFMRRTQGVEIHTLISDDSKQILIWDLAGQDIFRAMQEYLFPKLNRACIFLFVFSPVNHESKQVRVKSRLEEAFEAELRIWLRFIASNSGITGFNLPEVMVVVSHKDQTEDIVSNWTEHIVETLGREFSDVIHIHTTPYYVDCRQITHVQPIVKRVYSAFDEAFKEKLFKVPAACFEMGKIIMDWTAEHKFRPIIHYEEFYSLCEKVSDLQDLRSSYSEERDRLSVLRAVASYLHDVGMIIELPQSSLMVVNPNWLTYEFLGSLVCIKHGFQRPSAAVDSIDGFLSRTTFRHFLQQNFLKPLQKKGFLTLDLETLETLMKSLGLCYEVSQGLSSARFFVPFMFKAESEQKLEWQPHVCSPIPTSTFADISFYGLRVRCKDPQRTYLSSGFFSRFQITIWPKLVEQLSLRETQIECKLGLISLMADGHDILVENDEGGGFIDIMIRSIKSPTAIWDFINEFLLKELMDFCVSPRGSLGVELVVDILRKECVEKLTLRSHRKNQSVCREELKEKLKDSIGRQRENPKESDLYHHTWTSVPEANLQKVPEAAIDLLTPTDIEEIEQWVMNEARALSDKDARLRKVASELEAEEQFYNIKVKPSLDQEERQIRVAEQGVHSEHHGRETMEQHFQDVKQELHCVKQQMHDMHQDVRRVLAAVRELKSEILQMVRLQHKVLANCTDLCTKLDTLIGVSDPRNQLPKRPYFTRKDLRFIHRITAVVEIGKPLMLHFKCEEKSGHHFVENQPGFELTVHRENMEVLRLISRNTVRVIWYLLKAGLHVGAGLGSLLPELEMSDGSLTGLALLSMSQVLDTLQLQSNTTSAPHQDIPSAEESWRILQDYLKPKLENQITNFFLLHRAMYRDQHSTHAWLCQRCLQRGLRDNSIMKL